MLLTIVEIAKDIIKLQCPNCNHITIYHGEWPIAYRCKKCGEVIDTKTFLTSLETSSTFFDVNRDGLAIDLASLFGDRTQFEGYIKEEEYKEK